MQFKSFLKSVPLMLWAGAVLAACSTNPATGDRQFTALMSPAQENTVGAQEHQKVIAQYGLYENQTIQNYVQRVGEKVTRDTERPDVKYKFYVIDTPIVNAFALPGGYIYISRGLLALANSEAELAAVLGHEAGHITARHSAERYSHAAVTSIGTNILGAVIGNSAVSQALGVGGNLYLSSYSRAQENQSDSLGIRYLKNAGYDPDAMTWFLNNLQNHSSLQSRVDGKSSGPAISYFSTHPATGERIAKTAQEAAANGGGQGTVNREEHMRMVDGIAFGDSEAQGFVQGNRFFHPGLGFSFNFPQGYKLQNNPTEVVATGTSGAVMLFDMAGNAGRLDPVTYLRQIWMKGETRLENVETIAINGMNAATGTMDGRINGKAMTIQLIAIQFKPDVVARFQVGIPKNLSSAQIDTLKSATYSFRALSESEKNAVKPPRIKIVAAKPGDTATSMASDMVVADLKEAHFRVYNAMGPNDSVVAGRLYKIVVQ